LKKTKLFKALSLAVIAPVGIVLVTFSVVNRHDVPINFWPLPERVQLPLSAVVLTTLIVGVIWGGIAAWLAAGAVRRRSREAARRTDAAETEARQLKDRVSRLEADIRDTKTAEAGHLENTAAPALPPANAA